MGATIYDGGVTFRVWAPNANSVSVTGSFNGWNPQSNYLAPEGDGWWSGDATEARVNDQYKYVIDGWLWKVDPRAKDVVSSVGNGIIVDSRFDWIPFTAPTWNNMVIYEMHIGTFNDSPGGRPGNWQSAIAKLDHLQAMGINAIEVLPVAEFPSDFSWGYNPVNLYAPESAYGSPEDMREFINECHKRDIAVLLDVVYNHVGPTDLDNSLWRFDGSGAENMGGIYFYENQNRYTPWGDTRLNYFTGEVRSFIRDNIMHWLNEYNVDGFRWDGTAYIRTISNSGDNIPEGWSLMQWINNEIDIANSNKISIAEDMQNNEWLTKTTGGGGAGFDSQWDAGFHHKVVDAIQTANDSDRNMWEVKNAITNYYNGTATQRVIYTESHDEVGILSGNARVPEEIWVGNASSWFSKKRSTLGAGIAFTSPGIPMLFMGQEFLEDGAWHDNDPLDWSKATTYIGIKSLYTDLISLRKNIAKTSRGLSGNNVNVFHVNDTDKVIAWHRWDKGGFGDDVVIVANFSAQGYSSYNIGMPRGGKWHVRFNSDWQGYDPSFNNWISHDTIAYGGSMHGLNYNASIGLGPYTMVILSQGNSPDINNDKEINIDDFALLASQWQTDSGYADWNESCDLNDSGKVDMIDFSILLSYWLEGAKTN
ncbi:MAG: alpha amylase C-terminal domain-containing protein [Phycisphaerae bacterium]|nr:alpha amylase C-terminal domain-containing protein [Phycisphaerae bacterium]